MGNKFIVKQPNGKYAMYSTSCDQFEGINLTKEDLLKIKTNRIHAEYQRLLKQAEEETEKQISTADNPPEDDKCTWEGMLHSAHYWHVQNGSGQGIFDALRKEDWFIEWAKEKSPLVLEEDNSKVDEIWRKEWAKAEAEMDIDW